MAKMEDLRGFDWLPGFKEMMACQEEMQNDANRSDRRDDRGMETPESWRNDEGMETPESRRNDEGMETPRDWMNDGGVETPRDWMNDGGMETPESRINDRGMETPRDWINDGGMETPESRINDRGMETPRDWINDGEMETPENRRNDRGMETPRDWINDGEMETPENRRNDKEMQNEQGLLPPEQLQKEEQENWKDFEYLIGFLPAFVREIWVVADAILDRYEFEGSSIYAEYPDKESIRRISDLVYDKLKYRETNQTQYNSEGEEVENYYYMPEERRNGNTPFRHLILLVLLWNMAYRRQRYFRRNRLFRR